MHGLFLGFNSTVNISESAFSNNSLYEIKFRQNNGSADLYIEYSFIEDEQHSIYINGYGTVTWGEGNIDGEPLFCNASNGDFTLAENSPLNSAGEFGSDVGALGVGYDTGYSS